MMGQLTLFEGGNKVGVFSLDQGELTIGRDPACQIHIESPEVSWHHARVYTLGEASFVEDSQSTNGTLVNGAPITKHCLRTGDTIRIGSHTLAYKTDAGVASNYMASEHTMYMESLQRDEPGAGVAGRESGQDGPNDPAAIAPASTPALHPVALIHGAGAWLTRLFPILQWLPRYERRYLRGDLTAGVTVAAMLIPQGMAYAMLAGLPPIVGLYAALAPPLVYAFMGTSRQLSVAPVALDSLLVAAGVGAMAELGSEAFIALVILLALMVGLIQFLMGISRLGFLVNFLSYPVICGFTSAAALIIAFSQLKHLLGIPLPQTHHIHTIILATLERLDNISTITLLIGVVSIAFIAVMKRWNRRFPGAITVVVIATFLVWALGLEAKDVKIVGEVPSGLPVPGLPDVNLDTIRTLLPLALTIALVGFMEAISVAKAFAAKNHYRVDANQELIAIGMANVVGSVFKGYPVTGGFSRSAVNAQAGAQTGLASIITAALIALTLLFMTSLFYYLPKAVLAAIIMTAVAGLIDTKEMRYLFKVKKSEGALLVLTLIATLTLGITQGLLLGVVTSVLLFISLNTRPHTAILGRLPNTNIFRNIKRFEEVELVPGVVIVRIDASFYFANVEFLKEKLYEIAEEYERSMRAVILDASSINDLDSSADTALREIANDFKNRGIELYIAGVKGPVRDVMKRSGLYDTLGADYFFYTIDAAVKRFQSKQAPDRAER